jgi:molybdate transport system substrate-binding protein
MERYRLLLIFSLFFGLSNINPAPGRCQTIRVAVAANAQFVTGALKEAFQKKNRADVQLVVSSSGKLTAQITHGAPYDIFLSADMKYPEHLYTAGYTLNKPETYAYGSLVLWVVKNVNLAEGLDMLKSGTIKTIAVANPATAPYGVAAIQALKKAGIYKAVKDKIVYGESIAQVNQYLLSGVADAAFTAKSVVKAPALAHKGRWIEPADTLYSPIRQGAVILKHARDNDLTDVKAFYEFLSSPEGKSIFESFGYRTR